MTSKELNTLIKKAHFIRVIFHNTYLPVTKQAMLKVLLDHQDKTDWECHLIDGYLIIE